MFVWYKDKTIKISKYIITGRFYENRGGKFIVFSTMTIKAFMKMRAMSSDCLEFEKLDIHENKY